MTQEENSSLPSPTSQNEPTTEKPKRKSRKQSDRVPDIFDEQAALQEQQRQATAQAESAKPARQDEGNHVERLKFPEPFGVQNIANGIRERNGLEPVGQSMAAGM